MALSDILFIAIVGIYAHLVTLYAPIKLEATVQAICISLAYILVVLGIISFFSFSTYPTQKLTEAETFLNLIWYNLAKPTGAGIVFYALPLAAFLFWHSIRHQNDPPTYFSSRLQNLIAVSFVCLLRCLVVATSVYFLYVFIWDPPPFKQRGLLKDYLTHVASPLRETNRYDYWMYGYMVRDSHFPDNLRSEVHHTVKGLTDEQKAVRLVYWVGQHLEYDPISIDLIQPLFPGFNYPLEKLVETGKGTALEFSRLYNAAAIYAGLTSRIVVGKAKIGRLVVNHVWNEVRINKQWIPVDPTWSNTRKELYITLPEELSISDYARPYEDGTNLLHEAIRNILPAGTRVEVIPGKLWFGNFEEGQYEPLARYSPSY